MDPVLLTTLTSAFGQTVWEKLYERLFQARDRYRENIQDISSPYELRRQLILEKITLLQSDVILSRNQDLLIKILPRLVEILIDAYEANSEQDLKLVDLKCGRIEGALQLNRKSNKRRALARSLAIFVSLFALAILASLIYWATLPSGPKEDSVIPIIQVPLPILVWSAIGSFAAILYRFNQSGDAELQDPLRWLFTRPLTGIVMGIVAYFVLKVGFLSFSSENEINYGTLEVLWLVSFIGGFSDRFSDTILRLLVGRFGGDSEDNILSLEDVSLANVSLSLKSLIENFPTHNNLMNGMENSKNYDLQQKTKTNEENSDLPNPS